MVLRARVIAALLLAACGGGSPRPAVSYGAAAPPEPALEPAVTAQRWYRATSTCAQGPWELEIAPSGARWGEEIELRLATPRRIGLHAELLVDDDAPLAVDRVLDPRGGVGGTPDNARCVADARERLVLARGGGTGGGGGTPGSPAVPGRLVAPPPQRTTTTAKLELDEGAVTSSIDVVRVSLRDRPVPAKRIRIRFWSAEPNDLEGVLFGIAHIEWRPNVPEAEYVAYLELRERRMREQIENERLERERIERSRRESAQLERERRARVTVVVPAPVVTVKVDPEAARRRREAEERERLEAERIRAKLEREAEDARRRRAIEAALEIERRERRQRFCATHPDDRGCWGPGGYAMHVAFENHRKERTAYCAVHAEDARCWSAEDRARRKQVWQARIDDALAPPPPPDGPPPDPLAEETPPKLSANAEWRPGYWQWTAGTWVWLAGMWRVPDEDIASEQTTTAPAAPPPPKPEAPPPPPVRVAVWVPGFWQWSGATWVWVGGSYQLRPDPRTRWHAAEWQPRGSVHVLIPGRWVRLGGGR